MVDRPPLPPPRRPRPDPAGGIVYSVVAPVWHERETLPHFYRRVVEVMEGLGEPFELILVIDGSTDGSKEIACGLSEADPRVRVLAFSRNFGHQIAITAGLDFAVGQAVVVIDSDLQDPPEVIRDLAAHWLEGYDVVYATRRKREGETRFKLLTASLFYRLIDRVTSVDIPRDTGDFRLMDQRAVNVMRRLREHHRFMRGLSAWVGFRQIGVPYDRRERFAGQTQYTLRRMVKLAADAITSFSYLPLQVATSLGFAVAGLGALGILITVLVRIFTGQIVGQATVLVVTLFLFGIVLWVLGVIGEYIGRIYDEVKDRPLYIVDEAHGFVRDLLSEEAPQPEAPASGVGGGRGVDGHSNGASERSPREQAGHEQIEQPVDE